MAGVVTIWVLAGATLLFGVTASADGPIRLTLVPLLVAPATIANAITLISINFNAARLDGPTIGGLLIGHFGAGAKGAGDGRTWRCGTTRDVSRPCERHWRGGVQICSV